jgi:hypothetical protein
VCRRRDSIIIGLKKLGGGLYLTCADYGSLEWLCKSGNKLSVYIKGCKFLGQLSDYQLLSGRTLLHVVNYYSI